MDNFPHSPAQVLEDYNIIGKKIPTKIIEMMARDFHELEKLGVHSWRQLLDVPTTKNSLPQGTVIYIKQAIAEVLLQSAHYRTSLDGLSWDQRIEILRNKEDFFKFFKYLNISEEIWRHSNECIRKHPGLYLALRRRFGNLGTFVACMDEHLPFEGIQSKQQALQFLDAEIRRRRRQGDQQQLESVSNEEYEKVLTPLYERKSMVIKAVVDFFASSRKREHAQMSPIRILDEYDIVGRKISKALIEQVRKNVHEMDKHGVHPWRQLIGIDARSFLKEKDRKNTKERVLSNVLYIKQAIAEVMSEQKNQRKGSDGFHWTDRIIVLHTREDFLRFFECLNLPTEVWKRVDHLRRQQNGLFQAIYTRFGGNWNAFLDFMKVPREERHGYWTAQVDACSTRKDFMRMFGHHGIGEEVWSNMEKIRKANEGIFEGIIKKFAGNRRAYLDFMHIQ